MKLILLFFLYWMLPTAIIAFLPMPSEVSSVQLSLTLYLFIGMYLMLASSLSYWLMNQAFFMSPKRLWFYAGLVCLISVSLSFQSNKSMQYMVITAALSTANLLFGATLLGAVLSTAIKRAGELVPVCLTAAAADVASVLAGPSRKIAQEISAYYSGGMQGQTPLVDALLVKASIPGYQIPLPLFGVSDWIILVLLSSALVRLDMTDNLLWKRSQHRSCLYFPVTALGLYIALLAAQISDTFLPAMVFICSAFLVFLMICYRIHRHMSKADYLNSALFPAVTSVIILLISYR